MIYTSIHSTGKIYPVCVESMDTQSHMGFCRGIIAFTGDLVAESTAWLLASKSFHSRR